MTSLFRTFDTCDIPTKRSRLSLPGINDSLTCTEIDDFNFKIDPTCSTNNFDKLLKTTDNISTLHDVDSAMASKPIVQKDESKSHYFKQEEQESESKSFVVNMLYTQTFHNNFSDNNETINNNIMLKDLTDKEEKPDKQRLMDKLLRNF